MVEHEAFLPTCFNTCKNICKLCLCCSLDLKNKIHNSKADETSIMRMIVWTLTWVLDVTVKKRTT